LPSNLNGRVTTAIVSAPSSVARLAITGAAPVPVPPPRPVVTNTMSAPDSAWIRPSVSSSAAWRPMFGSAPAPRPLVSLPPIWIFTGAGLARRACRSVLTAMNSMPCSPFAIMREMALPPPPPTPTTLMCAPRASSSTNVMRFGASLCWIVIRPPWSARRAQQRRSSRDAFGTAGHEPAAQADPLAVGRHHGRAAHLAARLTGLPGLREVQADQLALEAPGKRDRRERHAFVLTVHATAPFSEEVGQPSHEAPRD